ncbi:MAG: hypothetical protein P1U90_02780 [Akkermansiaceae bacterium]|nr:hypothetical protein [Akkermansiaceae bacterium]
MNLKKLFIFAALGFGALQAQNIPQETPKAEIIGFEPQPDGVDIIFTGDPNQLYAVYTSEDGNTWNYLTMGAHLDGDHFHVHDSEATNAKKRLYRIVVINQNCRQVDPWTTENLLFRVNYSEFLSEARQNDLRAAARQFHESMNATLRAVAGVKQAQTGLAEFLKDLSEKRFAWIEARHATDAAMKAKELVEKEITKKKKALEEQKEEQEKARRMRDQQLHEKGVFLDWAKKFNDAGDTRKADEMRANAEEAQKRFAVWNDEVNFQDDAVESLEIDIADREAALPDHDGDIEDKKTAEQEAKDAYDKMKEGKAPLEKRIKEAKQAVEDAERDQKTKQRAWADKARKARDDGKKESDRRAAATHAASEAGKAGVPAPKPTAPKPSARAVQIARFLEHIKEHGGVDQYNRALRTMFGASLEAGLVTLKGLGAAMAQWATGKAASGGAVGTALASGVVSFGYGVIAGWVQDAAGSATRGIATDRMVGMIFGENLYPGDAKYSPGRDKQKSTAELYLYNTDGTVTIMVFRSSQGLTVKNYRIKRR